MQTWSRYTTVFSCDPLPLMNEAVADRGIVNIHIGLFKLWCTKKET